MSMEEIKQYKVLEGGYYPDNKEHSLDNQVKELLKEGWELYGNPYPGYMGKTCQVLVKRNF